MRQPISLFVSVPLAQVTVWAGDQIEFAFRTRLNKLQAPSSPVVRQANWLAGWLSSPRTRRVMKRMRDGDGGDLSLKERKIGGDVLKWQHLSTKRD